MPIATHIGSHYKSIAKAMEIVGRKIGRGFTPFVIAEIGINHEGSIEKAIHMIDGAAKVGCECVKFQTHIPDEEMVPNEIVPSNATESIWSLIRRCSLSGEQEATLKQYTEKRGMIFLSTPFSSAGVERLQKLGVAAFKIGSGECNNLRLVTQIAKLRKPVILSTGMNDITDIRRSVDILHRYCAPFALLHCTSLYPTPDSLIRLGAIHQLQTEFPDAVIGLSDHSPSIYPALGAVALGANIIERHFTSDKSWPGPDISISMDPSELQELIRGSVAIHKALGGKKEVLPQEEPTMRFAFSSVTSKREIRAGEIFDEENLDTKRPGTGEIPAPDFFDVMGRRARSIIEKNAQLRWDQICD